MNRETNDHLWECLTEAHETFAHILRELKDNNVDVNYQELETTELECYKDIVNEINQMEYCLSEATTLKEDNIEIFNYEYSSYVKYITLYGVSFAFLKLFHIIFNTADLTDMAKYAIGMFLGSTYVGLLSKDIHDNRNDTKEKRDLINKLKTMKEDYKKSHDKVEAAINGIFDLNGTLWDKLDKEMVKRN